MSKVLQISLFLACLVWGGSSCHSRKQNIGKLANQIGRKSMMEQYPKVPGDELVQDVAGNKLYSELQERYYRSLRMLKAETDLDGVKLVVAVITPEVGKYATMANTYGIPFITQSCTNLGIDYIDFTGDVSEWEADANIDRTPIEGEWSRAGAAYAANLLSSVVVKYDDFRAKPFPAEEKPETFGDAVQPEELKDEDGKKKKPPYKLKINKQGLRMDHDMVFPKTKQTILLLGDSKLFNPYIDNEYIISEVLQRKFPGKDIVNAAHMYYTMEDHASLYSSKARYVEPDVVIVCSNGGDILDNYFSQRNRYSRTEKCYKPTELEKKFYKGMSK